MTNDSFIRPSFFFYLFSFHSWLSFSLILPFFLALIFLSFFFRRSGHTRARTHTFISHINFHFFHLSHSHTYRLPFFFTVFPSTFSFFFCPFFSSHCILFYLALISIFFSFFTRLNFLSFFVCLTFFLSSFQSSSRALFQSFSLVFLTLLFSLFFFFFYFSPFLSVFSLFIISLFRKTCMNLRCWAVHLTILMTSSRWSGHPLTLRISTASRSRSTNVSRRLSICFTIVLRVSSIVTSPEQSARCEFSSPGQVPYLCVTFQHITFGTDKWRQNSVNSERPAADVTV